MAACVLLLSYLFTALSVLSETCTGIAVTFLEFCQDKTINQEPADHVSRYLHGVSPAVTRPAGYVRKLKKNSRV